MRNSIFGWSYPPGCSGPPEYDEQCEVCGLEVDDCICPECPTCGEYGRPECYREHGLVMSKAQLICLERATLWELRNAENEKRFLEELAREVPCRYCGTKFLPETMEDGVCYNCVMEQLD